MPLVIAEPALSGTRGLFVKGESALCSLVVTMLVERVRGRRAAAGGILPEGRACEYFHKASGLANACLVGAGRSDRPQARGRGGTHR